MQITNEQKAVKVGMEMPVPADQAMLVREMDSQGSSLSSLIMTDWPAL